MRVIALGGAGEMGRWAARTVLRDERVEELVIADRDASAAASLAEALGPRARTATIDVRDGAALRTLLGGATVVINTVGPFFRFGLPILQAAIDVRCHYLDICDDWEPTLAMLELDHAARAAGIVAVIGLGASPGLSNLAAMKAAAALDTVEALYTAWSLDGASPGAVEVPTGAGTSSATMARRPAAPRGPSAATLHGVHQMTGAIQLLASGAMRSQRPLRALDLDYPGLGRHRVWTIGHPEAVTLPRTLGALRECANVMFASRSTIVGVKALMAVVDRGWASPERAAGWLERVSTWMPPVMPRPWAALTEPHVRGLPPLFALARGSRGGRPASAAVAFTSGPAGGMGAVTGIPLALGVSWLGDLLDGGAALPLGVSTPEAVIEPDPFLARLLPLCDPTPASVADFALLTTSWQPEPLSERVRRVQAAARHGGPAPGIQGSMP